MRSFLWMISVVMVVALTGCAQKLATYDYSSDFAFGNYKSYAFPHSGTQDYQSLDSNRIESTIDSHLSGRYQKVDPAQADFLVDYKIVAEHKLDQSGVSFGFGFGVSRNVGVGVSTGPKAKEVIEGRLVMEVVDKASNKMVWTAKAGRNLEEDMTPDQRAALIQDVVKAMLDNFPPQ